MRPSDFVKELIGWNKRYTRTPEGYELLTPIELFRQPLPDYELRVYDPQSDMVVRGTIAGNVVLMGTTNSLAAQRLVSMKIQTLIAQLDCIAWAMRKFNIPPSWQSAYYRVCGMWPEESAT